MTQDASALVVLRFEQLCSLLGRWRGEGRGQFPTIDDFRFVEETRFVARDEQELSLHYEQRTWVLDADGARAPSHWESGFFQVTDDGRIDVLNAQNSGRVEVLAGEIATERAGDDETIRLTLGSVVHGHDPRIVGTARRLWVVGDELRYEVDMATTEVDIAVVHLSARLRREK